MHVHTSNYEIGVHVKHQTERQETLKHFQANRYSIIMVQQITHVINDKRTLDSRMEHHSNVL